MDSEKPKSTADPASPADKEAPAPRKTMGDGYIPRIDYGRRGLGSQDPIGAAIQAAQDLDHEVDEEGYQEPLRDFSGGAECSVCGKSNAPGARFCAGCGVPVGVGSQRSSSVGQHHYHHHYHHHYAGSEAPTAPAARLSTPAPVVTEPGRARLPLAGTALSKGEAAVRQLAQDWAQACNTKHLDDLLELYSSDATILRPNVPPVRGIASARELFFSMLEAGLGDVEMESTRVELFGDVGFEAGKCKMLVPTPAGKRREERGKYLIVAVRQAGEWKIASDCWSSDLNIGVAGDAAGAVRPPRKP